MALVKVNTSDVAWVERRGQGDPVAYGTDIQGAVYYATVVEVCSVERRSFAGAQVISFDLGADAPRDASRFATYPASYLMSE